ncbi:MAG TPA: TROVE domain-containing protein [Catenuloplanes sp.]|jgi:hypothetical protein
MGKFNRAAAAATMRRLIAEDGPIRSSPVPDAVTHQGGTGYSRDPRSELFLLAVTNMVGERTFYESAADRDDRFAGLVRRIAVEDPAWTAGFLRWLRAEANMRSAALVGAAEATRALVTAGQPGARALIDSVLQRPDEPGELLAYWTSRHGRAIPKPVKRGVADAARRLYTEHALLKYDTTAAAFRFADVLDLVHPAPATPTQGELFRYALDRRHGRGDNVPAGLPTVRANADLRVAALADPSVLLDPDALRTAGMTWEDALSLAGARLDRAALWTAMIPSMGYMALLRNLRGFDQAGVGDDVAATVATRLADPAQVARSRQLPMRFLSAYRAAPSLRWAYPLEQALGHALGNVPTMTGRTLIMIDTSGSMDAGFSRDGTLMRWDAATLFGLALAGRCAHADVVSFSDRTMPFRRRRGESVLAALGRWRSEGYFMGGGTNTATALRGCFAGHDRVVVLTDEQAAADGPVDRAVPATVPMVTFNLAGYRYGHAPSGTATRVTVGGLSDQAFRMIPAMEDRLSGRWPWQ